MKKVLSTVAALAVVVGGYFAYTAIDTSTQSVAQAMGKKTYSATVYVAGMGGHFSKADITIDPNDTNNPIKVLSVDMIDIGGSSHPTHDARIDDQDPSRMYWSTYKLDTWKDKNANGGNLHVGVSNLNTGEVIKDVAFPPPARAKWLGANYCGSGQTPNSFIPVSMADEGYIDIYDKKTMNLKHRIFFDDLGIKVGEITFAHGTNTPDYKKFVLTVNLTPAGFTKWTGNTKLMMLDMQDLENGKITKLAEGVITGKPVDSTGGTITFRQYFSDDGNYLFQSGADRGYLIDAHTLKVLDEITPLPGENHDIIPTPDGKYALMTLRQTATDCFGKSSTDGTLLLYDVEARKTVGSSASVCFKCHKEQGVGKAILCGIDAKWN